MSVYNYSNITYRISGISTINDPKHTKQEGLLIHLRPLEPTQNTVESMPIFLDKRDCARLSKSTATGRTYWKRYRLPRMVKQ